jgi:hypothetical protein
MDKAVQSHRDLKVWQKAMDLAVHIYGFGREISPLGNLPLAAQITRAAVGQGRVVPYNLSPCTEV